MSYSSVPAFLSIDVEPDGFQLSRSDPKDWAGYDSTLRVIEGLRPQLFKRSGVLPKFGWYFRMDPQVADVYGRPDFAVAKFPDRVARLREKGDYFGVHSHPIRWSSERRLWIHDFADAEWNAKCAKFALDTYAYWNGSAAQRFRAGAAFLANEIVEIIDQCGIKVDLTLEPVDAWPSTFSEVPSGIDNSPYLGIHSDYRSAPRIAYRPSRHDFRVPDAKGGRGLVMIPLATYVRTPELPLWRRALGGLFPQSRRYGDLRVLHLSEPWPSGKFYWDLVSEEVRRMRRPYVSLAIRTGAPDCLPTLQAQQLLESLFEHPLSKRLHFVDPLDVAQSLV